jgi:superfamily I DNA/RNA helicase
MPWVALVADFLKLLSRPVLVSLSPAYQQGSRLADVIKSALEAFAKELGVDGDASNALKRLSESDAVRFLTIHKCKGLEFEKVIVLGVEEQLFWGDTTAAISEFFVAISRAKNHLALTWSRHRERPEDAVNRWDKARTKHSRFFNFAVEN